MSVFWRQQVSLGFGHNRRMGREIRISGLLLKRAHTWVAAQAGLGAGVMRVEGGAECWEAEDCNQHTCEKSAFECCVQCACQIVIGKGRQQVYLWALELWAKKDAKSIKDSKAPSGTTEVQTWEVALTPAGLGAGVMGVEGEAEGWGVEGCNQHTCPKSAFECCVSCACQIIIGGRQQVSLGFGKEGCQEN